MKSRVVIPVAEENGLDSRLAEHFGRAPYFAVVDFDENGEVLKIETVSNTGEHFGGRGHMHDNILSLKPSAVIVYSMGPRGLSVLKSAGVAVLRAEGSTVREVVAAYKRNELQELNEECDRAGHL